jgi:hypothetical protein
VQNELTAEAMIPQTVVFGLGRTSAHTRLKVPIVEEMERAMAATTLPALVVGGEVGPRPGRPVRGLGSKRSRCRPCRA